MNYLQICPFAFCFDKKSNEKELEFIVKSVSKYRLKIHNNFTVIFRQVCISLLISHAVVFPAEQEKTQN